MFICKNYDREVEFFNFHFCVVKGALGEKIMSFIFYFFTCMVRVTVFFFKFGDRGECFLIFIFYVIEITMFDEIMIWKSVDKCKSSLLTS